jgi:hypothetical protein
VIYHFVPLVLVDYAQLDVVVRQASLIYMLLVGVLAAAA